MFFFDGNQVLRVFRHEDPVTDYKVPPLRVVWYSMGRTEEVGPGDRWGNDSIENL